MFTVVIPLYNKEVNIKDTIQSVLSQTYQEFEIVIVNDGSTDRSVTIVEALCDSRIRLLHQNNLGVSAARNHGIKKAKFEWIAFLDGDDIWKPNHLSQILKMITIHANNMIFATSFEYSDKRKQFRYQRRDSIFKVTNYFQEAIHERILWTGVVVAHKTCFYKVGYFNEKLNRGEDLDLWARIASSCTIVKSTVITAEYKLDDLDSLSKGRSNYNKSILSIIDLKSKSGFEHKYYKKMIINRIKLNVRGGYIKEIIKILIKHNFELLK